MIDVKPAVVITVRMKSKRLPNKAMLLINGKPIIEHIIDRAKLAKFPHDIVLCTSVNADDDILCKVAEKNGIKYFRGSEDDKLQRYLDASRKFGFTHMIDISADNMFFAFDYIDIFIEEFIRSDVDVIFCDGLPLGVSPVGLRIDVVRRICEMKSENDTEAYGPYIFKSKVFKVKNFKAPANINRTDIELTIDYNEDYELAAKLFQILKLTKNDAPISKIIDAFNRHPELLEINKEAQKSRKLNFSRLIKPKVKKEYEAMFEF